MKKIEPHIYSAPKLSGKGHIKYCLWVNEDGLLFVQMTGNEASGTYSHHLFSVSQYASKRSSIEAIGELKAYNLNSKKDESLADKNNSAFLKAVLKHLLPVQECQ
jgi:hypothetical protein